MFEKMFSLKNKGYDCWSVRFKILQEREGEREGGCGGGGGGGGGREGGSGVENVHNTHTITEE